MKDFILAALPFIVIGVCIAVMAANHGKLKEGKNKNYLGEGMCLGMCFGVAISTALNLNLGLGISLGMLIGETVGMFMKKD